MSGLSQKMRNLLAPMAQACKNIIAVSAPIADATGFENQDTIVDNIYMNLVIISENYAKTDDDIKQAITNWSEIKTYTEKVIPDCKNADCRVWFYISHSLIPTLKEKLDELLS
ncbi:MAG: hypothetical protein J5826_01310 [Bacteroidales bacterium]|nr:hypothetical protein [Bacteroidales bacterium]